MRKFARRWTAHSLSSPQKVARDEAPTEMLRILQESGVNHFHGIATGEESWLQYLSSSWDVFAGSRSDIIPRTRQAIGTKKTMTTVFFTASKLIVLDVLPKGWNFNQLYFLDNRFPDLKMENMRSRRRTAGSTFWVDMVHSMCPNGSKVESKFQKHHHPECHTSRIRWI
jgi:hypothetical protein